MRRHVVPGHVAAGHVGGHRLAFPGLVEAHVLAGPDRPEVVPVRSGSRRRGVDGLPVRILVVDHRTGDLRRRRRLRTRHGGRNPVGELDPCALDEDRHGAAVTPRPVPGAPRRKRGEDPGEPCRAAHLTAWKTSLSSTVPVSPWTFAPSDSRQPPAIVIFALKR